MPAVEGRKEMLYARTPQQRNGRVERATAQAQTVPQTVPALPIIQHFHLNTVKYSSESVERLITTVTVVVTPVLPPVLGIQLSCNNGLGIHLVNYPMHQTPTNGITKNNIWMYAVDGL